jgi:hypothetical protein
MGRDAQVLALYAITAPGSNMIGLFYLPLPIIAHETGIPFEGVKEAIRTLSEGGFLQYDEAEEVVWIPEMAKFQIGDGPLAPKDNRIKGIAHEAAPYRKSRFFNEFIKRYGRAYRLDEPQNFPPEPSSEGRGSSEDAQPLRSQAHAQAQASLLSAAGAGVGGNGESKNGNHNATEEPGGFTKWWNAYPSYGTRKKGRDKCLQIWIRKTLEPLATQIIASLDRCKASADWLKEGGKYIPGPAPWLNDTPWKTKPSEQGASSVAGLLDTSNRTVRT